MLIDCDSCAVRGAACKGCLVSALFDAPPEVERLDRRGADGHRGVRAGRVRGRACCSAAPARAAAALPRVAGSPPARSPDSRP